MRTFLKPIAALLTVGVVAIAFAVGLAALPTRAADHLDAPGLTSPGGDGRLDINDVYAFQSPANSKNTVLIMTVNPLAGAPGMSTFHPNASYEFLIDGNGDARPDTEIEIDFGKVKSGGVQNVEVEIEGPRREVEAEGKTGQDIKIKGGGMLRAGLFDDPFFFDLASFLAIDLTATPPVVPFCDPGDNFFDGLNVSAIVLEVPSKWLDSDSNIGVWARTVLGGSQIDRMGRPAINTVFIPANVFEPSEPSQKNDFNAGKPKNDQRDFRGEVVDTLEIFYGLGNAPAGVVDLLLPDILTVDTSSSLGFLNGRQLADDVIDAELAIVTNNAVTTDCVANDSAFTSSFPYLASPNP